MLLEQMVKGLSPVEFFKKSYNPFWSYCPWNVFFMQFWSVGLSIDFCRKKSGCLTYLSISYTVFNPDTFKDWNDGRWNNFFYYQTFGTSQKALSIVLQDDMCLLYRWAVKLTFPGHLYHCWLNWGWIALSLNLKFCFL